MSEQTERMRELADSVAERNRRIHRCGNTVHTTHTYLPSPPEDGLRCQLPTGHEGYCFFGDPSLLGDLTRLRREKEELERLGDVMAKNMHVRPFNSIAAEAWLAHRRSQEGKP